MAICEELEELVPAYVLDAVDEPDRARIEAHLPRCSRCTRLIESYRPVTDLLPHAARPVEPPAELKYRVLAATTSARRAPAQRPPLSTQLARLFGSLFRSPAFSAVALALVLALGVWNLALQGQVTQQAAATRQMEEELARQRSLLTILAYADGEPRHLAGTEVASRAAGRLYGGHDEDAFVVVTYDMPALPPNHVYQLWLIDSAGGRASGGTFTVDPRGRGWLFGHSPQPLGQYQAVGVTVEPLGGSPAPTGARMLGGEL